MSETNKTSGRLLDAIDVNTHDRVEYDDIDIAIDRIKSHASTAGWKLVKAPPEDPRNVQAEMLSIIGRATGVFFAIERDQSKRTAEREAQAKGGADYD